VIRPLPPTPEAIGELASAEKEIFSDAWSEKALLSFLLQPHARGIGLFREGRFMGYALFTSLCGEGELLRIAVSPVQRGKGFGRLLLHEVLALWQREAVREAYLEVRASGEAARNLYESAGFRQVGIRKGYYSHPTEDACLYTLEMRNDT